MATLKFNDVQKVYDNGFQAVYDFNLDIEDKEFIVFVGPSGCGKTTTLRMVAGLEEITDGDLYINGNRVNDVSPKDRSIAMVFQSYALYPHMSVYDNMAFGLKIAGMKKDEIDKKVRETAKILEIEELLDRKPKQLSGGQRQRVALGRAIVRDAQVFLMDEPLSNLDAKLRVQMRSEIIELHRRLGTTTIYVTHDQTEAMTMATRLVVMDKGYIQQIGTPKEIYQHPVNKFVASFIGSPAMNFIEGEIKNGKFVKGNMEVSFPSNKQEKVNSYEGKKVTLGMRPEELVAEEYVTKKHEVSNVMKMDVSVVELLGHEFIIHGDVEGTRILSKLNVDVNKFDENVKQLNLVIDADKLHLFDDEDEHSII